MIPEIGLMAGAYIITRLVELILSPAEGSTISEGITRGLAFATIVITLVIMVDLFTRGVHFPTEGLLGRL